MRPTLSRGVWRDMAFPFSPLCLSPLARCLPYPPSGGSARPPHGGASAQCGAVRPLRRFVSHPLVTGGMGRGLPPPLRPEMGAGRVALGLVFVWAPPSPPRTNLRTCSGPPPTRGCTSRTAASAAGTPPCPSPASLLRRTSGPSQLVCPPPQVLDQRGRPCFFVGFVLVRPPPPARG